MLQAPEARNFKKRRETTSERRKPVSGVGRALASQHALAVLPNEVWCLRCLSSVSRSSPLEVKRWLESSCGEQPCFTEALLQAECRPTRLPAGATPRVGQLGLHPSHQHWSYQGLYFCGECGATASQKPQLLSVKCLGPPVSKFRAAWLPRLKAGEKPPGSVPMQTLEKIEQTEEKIELQQPTPQSAPEAPSPPAWPPQPG